MTRTRKTQIHIAAVLVIAGLAAWIVILYTWKHQEEKGWENEFLTRYSAALSDVTWHARQFEDMESFEDQLSCLEVITNDLLQLKAYMELHINLAGISKPKEIAAFGVDASGWHEAETAIGFINNGGSVNSDFIEAFRTDSAISENEAAVIHLLREEAEELWGDMRKEDEKGGNDRYVLSSLEVYQRLVEVMRKVKTQLVQINRE